MRNAAEHVLEQVAALANQSPADVDFEVIWVDNGSSDGTLQLVASAIRSDHRMHVVSAPELQSSYFARNRGVARARAELLLFCDADDVVDERWVHSMTLALGDFDVVGGAVKLAVDGAAAVEAEPVFRFLPAAPTANLGIRRDAFKALGGFNSFIPCGEDTALCWRAQLQGFRFGFTSEAVVLHRRRATDWARIKRIWKQARWYGEWAQPFIPLGAFDPTTSAVLRQTIELAVLPALKHPRRDHARVAVWNAGLISSRVRRPKRLSP
jgi:GT2 family glycosyltransferase